MKTKTGNNNNKLEPSQLDKIKEKILYIDNHRKLLNKQDKELMILVSECVLKKTFIPYQEYRLFNSLFARITQASFDKDINNNKKVTIPEVPSEIGNADLEQVLIFIEHSDIPTFNKLCKKLSEQREILNK